MWTPEGGQIAQASYTKGFNLLLNDPRGMIRDYFEAIPAGGPPDAILAPGGASKPHIFPRQNGAQGAIKEARQAFEAANRAAPGGTPMAELGPPADQTITAIENVYAVFTEAQKYYAAEDYKDDKLAKGKALHLRMMAAAKEFDAAIGALEAGLSKAEDVRAAEDLKRFEGEKGYAYWLRDYPIQAKRFLKAAEKAESQESLNQLAEAIKPLEAVGEGIRAFVAAKGTNLAPPFTGYLTTTDNFGAAAKKLVRAVKEGKAPSSREVIQAKQNLNDRYNNLVDLENSMFQVEAAGLLK